MGACGITITNSQTGNWSATEGKAVTEAWLKESKDVNGIFAQNDEMGLGAIEALREAGLVPGKDVMVLTFDATAGAFKAMLAGEVNVAVECNPLLAPQVYEAALKAANGEELPKWVPSQEGVFRASDPNLQTVADGRSTGISVETVDLSEIFGRALKLGDSEPSVKHKIDEIMAYVSTGRVPPLILTQNGETWGCHRGLDAGDGGGGDRPAMLDGDGGVLRRRAVHPDEHDEQQPHALRV